MSIEDRATAPLVMAGRLLLLALLAYWTWRFVTHPLDGLVIAESFLHLVNLPFHEAGHILLSPFGQFLTSLGGSLMQVLVPLVCAVALARRGDKFGASVCAWWAGQNFVDLAPYIADARALQLPLLGGGTGAEVEGHDWEAILQALGWLHRDRQLGMAAHVIGSGAMIAALIAAAWLTWRGHRTDTSHTLPRNSPSS
jgi:hypothetical protein